jgi:hypothetical protein
MFVPLRRLEAVDSSRPSDEYATLIEPFAA